MRIALVVIQDKKLVNTVNFKKFIPIGFLFLLNIVFYFFVRGKVEYKIAEPFYLAFLGWAVVYILYVKNLLTKFTTTPKILENFYNKILVKIYEKIAQVSDFIELNFLLPIFILFTFPRFCHKLIRLKRLYRGEILI